MKSLAFEEMWRARTPFTSPADSQQMSQIFEAKIHVPLKIREQQETDFMHAIYRMTKKQLTQYYQYYIYDDHFNQFKSQNKPV